MRKLENLKPGQAFVLPCTGRRGRLLNLTGGAALVEIIDDPRTYQRQDGTEVTVPRTVRCFWSLNTNVEPTT